MLGALNPVGGDAAPLPNQNKIHVFTEGVYDRYTELPCQVSNAPSYHDYLEDSLFSWLRLSGLQPRIGGVMGGSRLHKTI